MVNDDDLLPDDRLTTVVVDGNNVIGSVPNGWWRDRRAAVRRLLARLVCYRQRTGVTVVLVLDVPQGDLPEGHHEGVEILYPRQRGRNAADHKIVELLGELDAGSNEDVDSTGGVEVVTSDRALASSAADLDAKVVGARTFLTRLDDLGC